VGRLARASQVLERLLEIVVIFLIIAMTTIVVVAVIYRKAGASLSWYDEIASITLAWLTYYGACLAALKRAHIGFDGVVRAVPPAWRLAIVIVSESCVIAFFAVLAWTGWVVLQVLAGDTLVSLPIPVRITQSVIPLGAAIFILCELVSIPLYWHRLNSPRDEGHGAPPAAPPPAGPDGKAPAP